MCIFSLDWLTNASYQHPEPPIHAPTKRSRDYGVTSDGDESDVASSRKKTSKHDRHHRSRKEKKGKDTKHKTESQKPQQPLKPNTIWISDTTLDIKDAYRVDKKPDHANLNYDTLYSGDQASYKRYFGDHCLGLHKDHVIKFTDRRSRGFKKKQGMAFTRYHKELHTLEQNDLTLLNQVSSDVESNLSEFLLIEVKSGKKELSNEEVSPEVYIMKRTSYYNQLLLEEPDNVSLWIEFILFQDEAMLWGRVTGRDSDTEQRQELRLALTERKIAIYERALVSNPRSIELIIGHMELVQEIWDTKDLITKWKDIVFYNANQSLLWSKYIEFCMSRFSFFQTDQLVSVFAKAISTLASIVNRTLLSHKPEQDAEKKILSLFVFYCYFLKLAGFQERSVCTFQALIEFNFLCPPSLSELTAKERIQSFQHYWESDEPCFGHDGAVGWANWEHGEAQSLQPLGIVGIDRYSEIFGKEIEADDEDDSDAKLVKGLPLNEAWFKLEMHKDEHNCLPTNEATAESDIDDPEHVILYEDISGFLFLITEESVRQLLLSEFIRFLGGPVSGVSVVHQCLPHLSQIVSEAFEVVPNSQFSSLVSPFGSEYKISSETSLYQDLSCDVSLNVSSPLSVKLVEFFGSTKHFISNVYNQTLSLLPPQSDVTSSIMCSWLQFELNSIRQKAENGSDTSKSIEQIQLLAIELLEKTSLARHDYKYLWDFTVFVESLQHQKKKISSLSKYLLQPFTVQRSSLPNSSLYCIAQCFIESIIGLREPMNCYRKYKTNNEIAIFVISSLRDSTFNPTLLPTDNYRVFTTDRLKTKEFFSEETRRIIAVLHSKQTMSHFDCFPRLACHIYCLYLCDGLNDTIELVKYITCEISKASEVQSDQLLEDLYVLMTCLIISHSVRNSLKPQVLRDFVYESLSSVPTNTFLLQALLQSEKRSFISGRLRRHFDSSLTKKLTSIVPVLFSIRCELERQRYITESMNEGVCIDEPLGGTVHRVRSLFRRGSEHNVCRYCPAFWKCFMKFEVSFYKFCLMK